VDLRDPAGVSGATGAHLDGSGFWLLGRELGSEKEKANGSEGGKSHEDEELFGSRVVKILVHLNSLVHDRGK